MSMRCNCKPGSMEPTIISRLVARMPWEPNDLC